MIWQDSHLRLIDDVTFIVSLVTENFLRFHNKQPLATLFREGSMQHPGTLGMITEVHVLPQ